MLRVFDAVANDFRKLVVLLVIVTVAFVALGVSFAATTVLAGHGDQAIVHACYAPWGKVMRYVENPDDCAGYESVVNLGAGDAVVDLIARVEYLEAHVPDCLSEVSGNAVFSGCDVHVNNGEGSTATKDGTGNLIVGYNENNDGYDRTGSHNIVVGIDHGYSEYGGLVTGEANQITGKYSSVSGGANNTASGLRSSVSGGLENEANDHGSSVSGGKNNLASGNQSSISGGENNIADGGRSSVSGGLNNTAIDFYSSVSGGQNNEADGSASSVSGGEGNTAGFDWSSVGGGQSNSTTATFEFLP